MTTQLSIHLTPGSILVEQFRVERVIGQGGFGVTYLATDLMLNRQVVLKECFPRYYATRDTTTGSIFPSKSSEEESFVKNLDRFEAEARMLARVSHPHIVRVLSVFRANNTAYFVMPYVGEYSLESRMCSVTQQRPDEATCCYWLGFLLTALDYLHGNSIFHRDIKPANILLTTEGVPVLIDFGCAREQGAELTMTVMASLGYAAPEQMLGLTQQIGPWTDLYALGAAFYSLLTGETPQRGDVRQFNDTLTPLSQRPELQGFYSSLFLESIDRAMIPVWDQRWRNASEWQDVLNRPVEVIPPVSQEEGLSVSPFGQKGVGWKIPLLAAVILCAGAAVWLMARQGEKPQTLPVAGELAVSSAGDRAEPGVLRQIPDDRVPDKQLAGGSEVDFAPDAGNAPPKPVRKIMRKVDPLIPSPAPEPVPAADRESLAGKGGAEEIAKDFPSRNKIPTETAPTGEPEDLPGAARLNRLDIVRSILRNGGADAVKINRLVDEPSIASNSPMVCLLKAYRYSDPQKNMQSLLQCIRKNDLPKIRSMLAAGVDLDLRADRGRTLLMEAAMRQQKEVADLLLQYGADRWAQDEDGNTVEHWIRKRRLEGMQSLFRKPYVYQPLDAEKMPEEVWQNWGNALALSRKYNLPVYCILDANPEKVRPDDPMSRNPDLDGKLKGKFICTRVACQTPVKNLSGPAWEEGKDYSLLPLSSSGPEQQIFKDLVNKYGVWSKCERAFVILSPEGTLLAKGGLLDLNGMVAPNIYIPTLGRDILCSRDTLPNGQSPEMSNGEVVRLLQDLVRQSPGFYPVFRQGEKCVHTVVAEAERQAHEYKLPLLIIVCYDTATYFFLSSADYIARTSGKLVTLLVQYPYTKASDPNFKIDGWDSFASRYAAKFPGMNDYGKVFNNYFIINSSGDLVQWGKIDNSRSSLSDKGMGFSMGPTIKVTMDPSTQIPLIQRVLELAGSGKEK